MKCVHLDFHTSPDISGIGKRFNKKAFTKTLKDAKIDSMTVFAKCHHGYTYYPSEVGTMHPNLDFDLLREEIDAIHDAGAEAPIYITMGWSKKDADEHPEWHHIDFKTGKPIVMGNFPDDLDAPLPHCSWICLCPVGEYEKYLERITHEVCQRYDVSDGIFYDICFISNACGCEACRRGMAERGLDPTSYEDAKKYYIDRRIEMMKNLTGIVHSYSEFATVFYNGGANMNRPEFHPYQTHFELEDLPTAWGGYDQMPLRAKYFERYESFYLGMTGKFHHAWGEFGGFKNKEALRYECADMLSVGASISVGDHLHPTGKLDESTYNMIGHAFNYVDKIEKYCEKTSAYTDIAIWLSHNEDADMGASKMLQLMHLEFDVIDSGDDLSKYTCIVLPDFVRFTEDDKIAIREYLEFGGKLIASYESVYDELGIKKIAPSKYDNDFIECELPDFRTPFLSYSAAYRTESDGEKLASVYEPYFSRTGRHFCGHKNTPNKTRRADYPALVKCEQILYFAHPIFTAYNESGNYVLEEYIKYAFDSFYERKIRTENLPYSGRVRLRKNKNRKFYALHLLYAPPVNRGNVCLLADFPTLYGVKIELRVDKAIKAVTMRPEDKPLDFVQNGDTVSFTVDPFSLHKLITLEW